MFFFFFFYVLLQQNLFCCFVNSTKPVQRPKNKEEYDEDDPETYEGLPVPDKV